MKKIFLMFAAFFICHFAQAITIKVQANKTLALFNYLDFVSNYGERSGSSLMDSLRHEPNGRKTIKPKLEAFRKLNFGIMLKDDGSERVPGHKQGVYNKDLLYSALSNSTSVDDMAQRVVGFLSPEDYNTLVDLMRFFEPIYDRLIWNNNVEDLNKQVESMRVYIEKQQIEANFERIKTFYNSQWSDRIPFVINLCPVPGRSGITQATPHVNVVVVQILTKRRDQADILGVVFHEMCHLLYAAQSEDVQQTQFDYLNTSKIACKSEVVDWLDEGLATAIGNGWVYKKLTGALDTTDWYQNMYINKYAKAIFPSVESYLEQQKPLDSLWFAAAIKKFETTFPDAVLDPQNFFSYLNVACDENVVREFNNLYYGLFEVRSYSTFVPINDPTTLQKLSEPMAHRMVLITENHEKTYEALKKIMKLPKLNPKEDFYYLTENKDGVTTLILNIQGSSILQNTMDMFSKMKRMERGKVVKL